jgi:hypothetical protein
MSPDKQNHRHCFPVSQLTSTNVPQSDNIIFTNLDLPPNCPEDGYMLVMSGLPLGFAMGQNDHKIAPKLALWLKKKVKFVTFSFTFQITVVNENFNLAGALNVYWWWSGNDLQSDDWTVMRSGATVLKDEISSACAQQFLLHIMRQSTQENTHNQ